MADYVYLVNGSQGQWDDHYTWVEAVFSDNKQAKSFKRWAEDRDDEEFAAMEPDDRQFRDPISYRIERKDLNPTYGEDDEA